MNYFDWLSQLKVGDTVVPYIHGEPKASEEITRASRIHVSIGKFAKTIRFSRATGMICGHKNLKTLFRIGRPDEIPADLPERGRGQSLSVAEIRNTTSPSSPDKYRAQAWHPDDLRACAPKGPCVYMLWSGDRLFYIGSTVNPIQRLTTQRTRKRPTAITTIGTETERQARELEADLIMQFTPEQNQVVVCQQ